jgi:hypothetical protein
MGLRRVSWRGGVLFFYLEARREEKKASRGEVVEMRRRNVG